ncbi:MAG: NAD(P)(+) transhydrogenase (Re/Si-specific) subunit beta [Acidobacteriota bacterium]
MSGENLTQLLYLVSTGLFIMSLKWMSDPATARKGVFSGVGAMLLAVAGTIVNVLGPGHGNYVWILGAFAVGTAIGYPLSLVPLTAVPQRTALSHAFGGLAAGLVGTAEFYLKSAPSSHFRSTALIAEVILGYLTFTGSLMAAGKLQEIKWIPQRPVTYPFQNVANLALFLIAAVLGVRARPPSRRRVGGRLPRHRRARALRRAAHHPDRPAPTCPP